MLDTKISSLFHYRKLPSLIAGVENDVIKREALLSNLSELQKAIYYLDHELEQNWKINRATLERKWKEIYIQLSVLGIPLEDHHQYCRHIYKYQKHEEELRTNKSIHRLSMDYFYFYKSCDVKLLRQIIYDQYPALKAKYTLFDWKYFDLITEVNDDIDDLYEDMESINGNRFLISLRERGVKLTYDQFYDFLSSIKDCVHDRFKAQEEKQDMIDWTVEQVEDTLILLKDRCEGWKEYLLENESIVSINS